MGGEHILPQSVEDAADSLRASRVSKLDGTKLNLGDARCLVLAAGLEHTTTLQDLRLVKNGIGLHGIKSLSTVLSSLPKLHTLNLYRNRLQDAGADLLARSLAGGKCPLAHLWLGDNQITAFPDALLDVTSLKHLHLNENRLRCVPPGLASMPHVKKVDLDDNPLQGLPASVYMKGLTKLPGPRWELLSEVLLKALEPPPPEEPPVVEKPEQEEPSAEAEEEQTAE